jgi:hypothetical protein
MKNKKIVIIFAVIILIILICVVFLKDSSEESNEIIESTIKTAEVENNTIITTLTAPGEVKSAVTEKLSLDTSKSFLTMCVEKNETVKEGSNILKYTDGTYLTAPYDCVVTDYSVPVAKDECTVKNSISISSVKDLYMDINISEEQLDKVSVGQEVSIIANYDDSKTYTGTISKINAIGTNSGGGTTFAAVATIENDDSLKLGMSATCTVVIEKNEDVPTLPIEAVQIENNVKYVNLVLENGDTKKIEIETGKADSNNVQIVSGISLGDKVSYENVTVTKIESDDEDEENQNSLTKLFNNGKNDKSFDKGGF